MFTKTVKKLDPYIFCFQKGAHIEEFFDESKYVFVFIKDVELFEKYNEISEKVSNSIKKGFNSEPAENEKYLEIKIKSYEWKLNTHFHDDKISNEVSHCICL